MDMEGELLKLIEKDELEQLIKQKIASFHGLLTREVAVRLIAKERDILKQKEETYKLGEAPKGIRKMAFRAHVKKIWPLVTYPSGKCSQVVEVKDETGEMPLVFWNKDTELVKSVRVNDEINVNGVYEKSGELHFGYSGKLTIEKKSPFSELDELEDDEIVHLKGIISKIERYDKFVRDGRSSMGFSFMISNGKTERRVVICENVERGEKLKEGDEILIEGGHVNKGDITLDHSSRIKTRRKENMLIGTVKELTCKDEMLSVDVNNKTVSLNRKNALKFLGIKVADDIALSTVVELKRGTLINTRIAVKIEEKKGQVFIRG
ncbi:hypothetical protein KKB44_03205 [Candidatus Micrarchaeota archaeon]|nr:hypothetical protein [Candidatus Micrarchaeota archaeon]